MSTNTRERYTNRGEANDGKNLTGKILVLFILVLLGAIVFAVIQLAQATSKSNLSGETATVEQLSDDTIRLWIDLTRKDTSIPGYCIVTAVNYDRGEIGRREIVVPAGGNPLERIEVDVKTTEPAASGDVYGCSTDIPFYLTVPSS